MKSKQLYIPYLLTYYMNQTRNILIGLVGMLTISLLVQYVNAEPLMYEDQLIVCNFKSVCQLINIDDYMSDDKAEELFMRFAYDLDTFNMSELQ